MGVSAIERPVSPTNIGKLVNTFVEKSRITSELYVKAYPNLKAVVTLGSGRKLSNYNEINSSVLKLSSSLVDWLSPKDYVPDAVYSNSVGPRVVVRLM